VGCLKNVFAGIGCLVVLAAAAVAGYHYRGELAALYRRLRGHPASPPTTFVAPRAGDAARADSALAALARRGGPAYVDVTAGELASLIARPLEQGPRRVFDSVAVGLGEERIEIRGSLDVGVLPRRLLGPLREGLGRYEPVRAGGTLAVAPDAHVYWTVDRLMIREFAFPRAAIPAIVDALGIPGVRGAAVPIPLPPGVGDLRVRPAAVRAYRASPR
jgi:hypothetical protein